MAFLLAFLAAACSTPGSETTSALSTSSLPVTTAPPPTTTVMATSTTLSDTTTLPVSPVTVPLVMLRVDDAGSVTVKALICNTGEAEVAAAAASLVTGDLTLPLGPPVTVPPASCRGAFDPTLKLGAAGITESGSFPLTVRVDDGVASVDYAVTLFVDLAALVPPADQVAAYEECRRTYEHQDCVREIPYYPVPGSGEVMLVLGDLRAVGPSEWEDIATYQVADDTTCVPLLEGFLGIDGPRPIGWRNTVITDPSGTGLSAVPGVVMNLRTTAAEFSRFRDDLDLYAWRRTFLAGECGNEHEGTHLILGAVPLPTVLNEGLATFSAALDASGDLTQRTVLCSDSGWRFPGEETDRPFEDLDADAFTLEMINSAACFWEYLRTEFGPSGFQDVLRRLHAFQDPEFNYCSPRRRSTYFMVEVVAPALGVDLSALTEARWGFGATFTSCERV